jgi:hypothetical protein
MYNKRLLMTMSAVGDLCSSVKELIEDAPSPNSDVLLEDSFLSGGHTENTLQRYEVES